MGSRSRIPSAQEYGVRSAPNSYLGTNTIDAHHHHRNHDGLGEEQDDEDRRRHQHSTSVDRMHDAYRNSLPLHGVGVEEDCSALENSGSSSAPYHILTVDGNLTIHTFFLCYIEKDILPIETARARFLQMVVDYFIAEHTIEVANSEVDYSGQDKLQKRNSSEVQYEGDPRFALPLMYAANLYETLVNDVNVRLAPFGGMREKTIGVALEAAGGLYRKLAQKFPKKGPCSFRRRELATSLETRTRFPELVVQDQKRVRFVVVNGLVVVERPNDVPDEDAAWFKRLTGRHEMEVSEQDYKFYSPRHKYRRVGSQSVSTVPGLSPQNEQSSVSKQHIQPIQHQPHFDSLRQSHQQPMHQCQPASQFSHTNHFVPSQHMAEIPQALQSPSMSQHIPCMQSLTGGQVGAGRLHILPSPAKFCDGCGAPYLRESSKFCSECGVKRLGT